MPTPNPYSFNYFHSKVRSTSPTTSTVKIWHGGIVIDRIVHRISFRRAVTQQIAVYVRDKYGSHASLFQAQYVAAQLLKKQRAIIV